MSFVAGFEGFDLSFQGGEQFNTDGRENPAMGSTSRVS